MLNMFKKVRRIGCVLALSSMLLCSCSAPAPSALTTILDAAAPNTTDAAGLDRTSADSTKVALTEAHAVLTDDPRKTADTQARNTVNGVQPVSSMNVMCHPCGAAVMEDGSLLVTDVYNRVIWRVADGTSTVYAGAYSVDEDLGTQPPGGYNDASYKDSTFRSPWAIAPFHDGWAVSDPENHAVRLLRNGTVQTINARAAGSTTAPASSTVFDHPTGLAADNEGNLYVADTFADVIYKITPAGEIVPEVKGISEPMGICWQDGSLYAVESGRNRVVRVEDGQIIVLAGTGEPGSADGPAEEATFSSPQGIAVGSDGTIYVADTDNSAIRELRNGQVSTLYERDVRDLNAFFPVTPIGMLEVNNALYVCDPFARALLLVAVA